jgi:tetratricopeptide (TPR) repeat protein
MSIEQILQQATSAQQAGRFAEAAQFCRQVLTENPTHYQALHRLGLIEFESGNKEQGVSYIQAALRLNPHSPGAHYNLGIALKDLGQLDEAIACYCRALELKPDDFRGHANLGNILTEQGKTDAAIECYRRAIGINADYAEPHYNLGNALKDQGKFDEAIACYRRALKIKPDYAESHGNQAILLLLKGEFESGWDEYEWRWKTDQLQEPDFAQPRWDGTPLGPRTILLHVEQGFGDTIQFIRYAALLKKQNPAATIVVQCQPQLVNLLSRCCCIDRLVVQGDDPPAFDVHSPLLSLPKVLKITLETIPANAPYLSADPSLVALWRERLIPSSNLRIGINWQGRSSPGDHLKRNVPLSFFVELTRKIPEISVISLQKETSGADLASWTVPVPLICPGDDFDAANGAFMDTAAIMTSLDLVISSDTSIPHLAGALGVPVWVALPSAADWRWLLDRTDSPWYPTMRLFRQPSPGDWNTVFQAIALELHHLAK